MMLTDTGKCTITKFRDTAPSAQACIQLWQEDSESYAAAPANHSVEAGAGKWSSNQEHFFFHRMKLKGLGLNWKNNDSKSWVRRKCVLRDTLMLTRLPISQKLANMNSNKTAYKYRLRRTCSCSEPYNPDRVMRHCASAACSSDKEGTWYHVDCLKAQQQGLTRNSKTNPIAGFPTKRPQKVVSVTLPAVACY